MPTLTKPCTCRYCKRPMLAGEAFRWVKGKRPVHGFTKGSASGTVGMADAWKPAHTHDCVTQKIATDRATYIDEQCEMLAGLGATAEKISEFRAYLETTK